MNRLVLRVIVGMLAPRPGVTQTRLSEVTTVVLAITNGGGSGTFEAARSMHVWVDAPGSACAFDRWLGDTYAPVDPLRTRCHFRIRSGRRPGSRRDFECHTRCRLGWRAWEGRRPRRRTGESVRAFLDGPESFR